MNLLKKSFRKSEKKRSLLSSKIDKYYVSILDLPVWNWWKVHETSDATYLLIDKKQTLCDKAVDAFDLLQNDFVKHFGIDNKFKDYIRLKCDIAIAYNEQVITGDKATTLLIKVMEGELQEMFSGENKSNYFTAIVAIEKFLGRKLEIRKESTYDVYSYINELKKWQSHRR